MEADAQDLSDPVDLLDLGRHLLTLAGEAASGRAARNLLAGAGRPVTQTLLALTADAVLNDHTAPGPATLQVLDGSGVLTMDGDSRTLQAGEWVRIPQRRHGLQAHTDLVCLLTVATRHGEQSGTHVTA